MGVLEVEDLRLPWREEERRLGTLALVRVVVSDLCRLRELVMGNGSASSSPSSSPSSSASTSVYVGGASLAEGDVTSGVYSGKPVEGAEAVVGDATLLEAYRLRGS
jgi:hypothetical protein